MLHSQSQSLSPYYQLICDISIQITILLLDSLFCSMIYADDLFYLFLEVFMCSGIFIVVLAIVSFPFHVNDQTTWDSFSICAEKQLVWLTFGAACEYRVYESFDQFFFLFALLVFLSHMIEFSAEIVCFDFPCRHHLPHVYNKIFCFI